MQQAARRRTWQQLAHSPPPNPPNAHRRTCQRLAQELSFFNLEAPQLDAKLRPPPPPTLHSHKPDAVLMLVGGKSASDGPDRSQWIQYYEERLQVPYPLCGPSK